MVLSRARLGALAALTGCLRGDSVGAHADRCGSCHEAQQAALQASAHGPEPTALFTELHRQADTRACDSCHAPEPGLHPGLNCTTCHAAVGNAGEGFGQVVLDWNGPVRGPTGAAGGPHATTQSDFLTSSSLCGTCHEVAGPPGFRETTFTEWQSSTAAAAGVGCMDCHFDGHTLRGLQAEGAELVAETLLLSATSSTLTLTNTNPAHAVPGGAAWSRLLQIELDNGDTIVLSPRLSHHGQTVRSPLDATEVHTRSLEALESRTWPWPDDASRAELVYDPVAPALGSGARQVVAQVER